MGIFTMLLIFLMLLPQGDSQTKQSCNSPIYCQGDLLHLVQTSHIFNDSKTFVDMAMVNTVNETLIQFYKLMAETDSAPSRQQIIEFISKNFQTVGELEELMPRDFKTTPQIVKEIADPVVRKFVQDIHNIWPTLTRVVSYRVKQFPSMYSIIPVDNPFIIPGGRFKEYYYWDSYWIIKGLLLTDMIDTARGMIDNLISIVDRYGFVPNGGRIYYLNRSQPPLLTLMVAEYVYHTKDYEYINKNVKTLEKELNFWLSKRTVELIKGGDKYILGHYDSESDTPRPEAYKEDIETCGGKSEDEKYECYTDLKSGAESGYDFTARWFFDEFGEPYGTIQNINTRRVIPVDLNCFLFKCFQTIHQFYMILENENKAEYWKEQTEIWQRGINDILWHEEDGTWYDYDIKLNKPRRYYSASNLVPLWVGAGDEEVLKIRARRSMDYLTKQGIVHMRGGFPSTLFRSGEQWDYPNAWAPHQNMIILGLWRHGDEEVKEFASNWAKIWINSIIKGFDSNKVIFEKYNSIHSGQFGGGGEYLIQAGFGWSNGGVLELIDLFYRHKTRKYKRMHT